MNVWRQQVGYGSFANLHEHFIGGLHLGCTVLGEVTALAMRRFKLLKEMT